MRRKDWEPKLNEFLAGIYGTAELNFRGMDCAIGFVADAVKAMTGKDLASEFRGKYKSRAGAYSALKVKGYSSLAAAMDAKLEPKPVASAMRGDVVMREDCLGICMGPFALFLPAEGEEPGLVRVPVLSCERAWAV